MKRLTWGLLFVLAFAGPALAGQVTLTVGASASNGTVAFSLLADDSPALYVQVPVLAGDSGAAIAGKIKASVNVKDGAWDAETTGKAGNALVFSYYGTPVGEIDCALDTASASLTLSGGSAAVLQIDGSAVASGFDARSRPSYLTFSATGVAPYTVTLHPGQTAASIMDGVASYLKGLASRLSPTTIVMVGSGPLSVSLQTSDTGLQGTLALSEGATGPGGGIIKR